MLFVLWWLCSVWPTCTWLLHLQVVNVAELLPLEIHVWGPVGGLSLQTLQKKQMFSCIKKEEKNNSLNAVHSVMIILKVSVIKSVRKIDPLHMKCKWSLSESHKNVHVMLFSEIYAPIQKHYYKLLQRNYKRQSFQMCGWKREIEKQERKRVLWASYRERKKSKMRRDGKKAW